MVWIVVTLGCLLAGLIQAVTGFGSVVLMMIFPLCFDMIDAPALALTINQLFCTILCWPSLFRFFLWSSLYIFSLSKRGCM